VNKAVEQAARAAAEYLEASKKFDAFEPNSLNRLVQAYSKLSSAHWELEQALKLSRR
jgi:hypothetical protein